MHSYIDDIVETAEVELDDEEVVEVTVRYSVHHWDEPHAWGSTIAYEHQAEVVEDSVEIEVGGRFYSEEEHLALDPRIREAVNSILHPRGA